MRVPNGRPASRRPLVCGRRRGKSSPLVRPSVGRASIVSRGDGRIQEGREGGITSYATTHAPRPRLTASVASSPLPAVAVADAFLPSLLPYTVQSSRVVSDS